MKYALLILSIHINFLYAQNILAIKITPPAEEELVKTIALTNFKFRPYRNIIKGDYKKDIELIKTEITDKKNIVFKGIKIIHYAVPAIYFKERRSYLSMSRVGQIKSILVENKLFKPELITTKIIEKPFKKSIIGILNDIDIVELKISYTTKPLPKIVKKEILDSKTSTSLKQKDLVGLDNNLVSGFKIIKMPIVLREADIVSISVRDQKNNIISKFYKKFETRGKFEVEVPTNNLKSGVYTIFLFSLNGASSKTTLEITQKKIN